MTTRYLWQLIQWHWVHMALWLSGQVKMVCLAGAMYSRIRIYFLFYSAPAGPPQNLSTLITSSRSITLQWNPPRPDLQNGVIQHYSVQLVDAQTNQVLQYTSTQHSITISNLHPYYTYTCTVTAVTVSPGPAALVTFQLPQDGT